MTLRALRTFGSRRVMLAGAVLLAPAVVLGILSVTVMRGDPMAMVAQPFVPPGENIHHVLGTDMLGRDMLMQLAYGARSSLLVGSVGGVLSLTIGLTTGVLSGYFGGWVDFACTRITELFQIFPQLLLAIVLVAVLTPSIWSIILAIGLTGWTQIARVVRPDVQRLRHADFVYAAEIAGMGLRQLVLVEILPNIATTVVVLFSNLIGVAILTEAALSFLGLGDPNVVSWGSIIGAGRSVLQDAWYVSAWPGLAILTTVLGFTLFGSGLGDALNRRTRMPERRREADPLDGLDLLTTRNGLIHP
jgi:peptide/nickel transport system permease protein